MYSLTAWDVAMTPIEGPRFFVIVSKTQSGGIIIIKIIFIVTNATIIIAKSLGCKSVGMTLYVLRTVSVLTAAQKNSYTDTNLEQA